MNRPGSFPRPGGRLDRLLGGLPIRRKLILGMAAIIAPALILAFAAVVMNEGHLLRTQAGENLLAQARIVADNSAAALLFDDAAMAQSTLKTLAAAPKIRGAALLRPGRRTPFAEFVQERGAFQADRFDREDGFLFTDDSVYAFAAVVQDGRTIGRVVLAAGLDHIDHLLQDNLAFTAVVFGFATSAFLLYVAILQRYISNPLIQLTELTRRVSQKQDYSLRCEHSRADELGSLSHSLNDMLNAIQARDDELAMHRHHLQEMVDSRTRELNREIDEHKQSQASLAMAKAAAENANRAKSEFLANMSHELRTPMHAILSFTGMGIAKLDRAPKEKLRHYFTRIKESGDRLLALLNDLLDLSKLEAGRMQLHLERHDLVQSVRTVVQELDGLARDKALQLVIPEPPVDTRIPADKDRFMQVIRNLLSNAIKFSPRGDRIEITFAEDDLPVGKRRTDAATRPGLAVSVSDRGIGVPESELDSIFDKFVQSSKTRSGAGGTGLGLAICKEIAEGHGGRIRARPNPGGGTVFTVSLPR